jgi:GT2 family glycosyltransferase
MEIAVLMTCFNRVDKTLKCLCQLFANDLTDISLSVYLVDDGSTDGTAKAVSENFPEVNVIQSDGGLFWNKGMHLAFSNAMQKDYDAFLMFNDDTMLQSDAISLEIFQKVNHIFISLTD